MFSPSSTNTPLSSYPFSTSPFLVLGSSSTIDRAFPPNFVARLILSSTSKRSKDSVIPKQPISPSKPSKKDLRERAEQRERRFWTFSSPLRANSFSRSRHQLHYYLYLLWPHSPPCKGVTISSVEDLEGMMGGFWEEAAKEAGF